MIRITLILTDSNAEPRTFAWDPAESCEWYDARICDGGALGIFHCADPAGGDYSERMVEAYAPGLWRTVGRS